MRRRFIEWQQRIGSRHLVFLLHTWLCAPFFMLWTQDQKAQMSIGPEIWGALQPWVWLTAIYLVGRTIFAIRTKDNYPWEYWFPPIDVIIISVILFISERGPTSNLTLLFFLPMVAAASSLNVRWAFFIGIMVVGGTAISSLPILWEQTPQIQITAEVLRAEKLNASFRLYFLIILASLMAYQTRFAAELRAELGVAADRNRIAMDMHDGVQGHLIAITAQSELAERLMERQPERAKSIVTEIRAAARDAADELRFLVHRLRTPVSKEGFDTALRNYASNICSRNGLELLFTCEAVPKLSPDAESAVFRIAQEALNNVVKHSSAQNVVVVLNQEGLEIRDDGVGLGSQAPSEGMGLANMRSRAERVGFSLDLRGDSGTVVHIGFA
jgi:signal transduction histidine kinase